MPTNGTVLSYPIPLYANVAIQSQFYQPSRFVISAITLAQTTTVTTSVSHNYVVGQNVRFTIPVLYGTIQLNEMQGLVSSIPSTTQFVVNIDSRNFNAFIATPTTATITGATKATQCVLTCSSSFKTGNQITISGVSGMTQLNGIETQILRATSTTLTLNVNSTGFSAYVSGGTATLVTREYTVPQVMAIGEFNSGQTNTSGITNTLTYVPGSFINISPE